MRSATWTVLALLAVVGLAWAQTACDSLSAEQCVGNLCGTDAASPPCFVDATTNRCACCLKSAADCTQGTEVFDPTTCSCRPITCKDRSVDTCAQFACPADSTGVNPGRCFVNASVAGAAPACDCCTKKASDCKPDYEVFDAATCSCRPITCKERDVQTCTKFPCPVDANGVITGRCFVSAGVTGTPPACDCCDLTTPDRCKAQGLDFDPENCRCVPIQCNKRPVDQCTTNKCTDLLGTVIGPCYIRPSSVTGDKECACCDIKPEDCAKKFQIFDAANCACRDPIGPLRCEDRTTPDWCAAGPCRENADGTVSGKCVWDQAAARCKCGCDITQCPPGQILDAIKCQCLSAPPCSSFSSANTCANKFCPFNPNGAYRCFWSQGSCRCCDKTPSQCPAGTVFQAETCSCVPVPCNKWTTQAQCLSSPCKYDPATNLQYGRCVWKGSSATKGECQCCDLVPGKCPPGTVFNAAKCSCDVVSCSAWSSSPDKCKANLCLDPKTMAVVGKCFVELTSTGTKCSCCDKTPESCPAGTVFNPDTCKCDPRECPQWPTREQCVRNPCKYDQATDTSSGKCVWKEAAGGQPAGCSCCPINQCPPGQVLDLQNCKCIFPDCKIFTSPNTCGQAACPTNPTTKCVWKPGTGGAAGSCRCCQLTPANCLPGTVFQASTCSCVPVQCKDWKSATKCVANVCKAGTTSPRCYWTPSANIPVWLAQFLGQCRCCDITQCPAGQVLDPKYCKCVPRPCWERPLNLCKGPCAVDPATNVPTVSTCYVTKEQECNCCTLTAAECKNKGLVYNAATCTCDQPLCTQQTTEATCKTTVCGEFGTAQICRWGPDAAGKDGCSCPLVVSPVIS